MSFGLICAVLFAGVAASGGGLDFCGARCDAEQQCAGRCGSCRATVCLGTAPCGSACTLDAECGSECDRCLPASNDGTASSMVCSSRTNATLSAPQFSAGAVAGIALGASISTGCALVVVVMCGFYLRLDEDDRPDAGPACALLLCYVGIAAIVLVVILSICIGLGLGLDPAFCCA